MRNRILIAALLCFAAPLAAFAEPNWNTVKEIIRGKFTTIVNCPASDLIKIEDAKEAYYWKDKDQFPPAEMYAYPGWAYYKGELPGEIRRQKIIANFELIAGKWQFKFCGAPVDDDGNQQVKAATNPPPLPTPPSLDEVKAFYIAYLKEKYSDDATLIDLSVTKFAPSGKLAHVKNSDGSYANALFQADADIEFTATVKDDGRYQKITGKGPAKLSALATKDPAAEWYKSTKVDKWNISVLEDPIKFSHDYETIDEPTSGVPSLPSGMPSVPKNVPGLRGFLN